MQEGAKRELCDRTKAGSMVFEPERGWSLDRAAAPDESQAVELVSSRFRQVGSLAVWDTERRPKSRSLAANGV